jgi:hypothetical protein
MFAWRAAQSLPIIYPANRERPGAGAALTKDPKDDGNRAGLDIQMGSLVGDMRGMLHAGAAIVE